MRRIRCVGAVVRDAGGRLLVVRRGREPGRGLWSVPGGRVEAGEDDATAAAREVLEETGVVVEVGRLLGTVERAVGAAGRPGDVYEIHDYAARPGPGPAPRVRAGDDADDARWVTVDQLRALPTVPGLLEALVDWGQLRGPVGPAG